MTRLRRYAYLHARVSALTQRCRMPGPQAVDSADELRALLAGAGLETGEIGSPATLERRALQILVFEGSVLVRSLTGVARALLRHWLRRYELMNMKALLRSKLGSKTRAHASGWFVDMGALTGLPLDDLIHADDLQELLRRLESTPYSAMAAHASRSFAERHDLFSVEASLERAYYVELARRVNALSTGERVYSKRFLGVLLDQVNLVWLLRLRFSYGLEPPQTFFILSPMGSTLGDRLLRLVRGESFSDVINRLPHPLQAGLAGATSIEQVETYMEARTTEVAERLLRTATFDPARALVYLYLRELQLRRLYTLFKAQQLRLSAAIVDEALGHGSSGPGEYAR